MKVLIDVDGVIYNILDAIKDRNPKFNPDKVFRYNFTKSPEMGICREEVLNLLFDPETFRLEKPYPFAIAGIDHMKEHGIELIANTIVPKEVIDIRKKQLECLHLEGTIYCYDTNIKGIVEECDYIIDDNPTELEQYPEEKRILIGHSYNKWYDKAKRYNNLWEAANYLVQIERGIMR